MSSKTERLRELLDRNSLFIAPEVLTVLTARIAEKIGFPAVYIGGHSLGSFVYGLPDFGQLSPQEMIETAGRIARGVDIPVIVDADELGDNVASVYRNLKEYEALGVSGLHMEDEVAPKHSAYRPPLMTIADMQGRIETAVAARTDPNFLIVARSNELLGRGSSYYGSRGAHGDYSLKDAIRRGQAYAEAGADGFLCVGVTAEEIPEVVASVPIPLVTYGKVGDGTGISMVLQTGWANRALGVTYERMARYLFEHQALPPEASQHVEGFYDLLDEPAYDEVVRRWAEKNGLPTSEVSYE